MLKSTANKSRGFSLMEIMVAVIIIGIISVVAVPKLFNLISGSQDKASTESFSAIVREAVGNAAIENAGVDTSSDGSAAGTLPTYLQEAVRDQGGSAKYLLCKETAAGVYTVVPTLVASAKTPVLNGTTANSFKLVDVKASKMSVMVLDGTGPGATIVSATKPVTAAAC